MIKLYDTVVQVGKSSQYLEITLIHILEILIIKPYFRYFQTAGRFPKQYPPPLLTLPLPPSPPRHLPASFSSLEAFCGCLFGYNYDPIPYLILLSCAFTSLSRLPFPSRPPFYLKSHTTIPIFLTISSAGRRRCVVYPLRVSVHPFSVPDIPVSPSNICFSLTFLRSNSFLLSGSLYPGLRLGHFILR